MRLLAALLIVLPASAFAEDGGTFDAGPLAQLAAEYGCPDAPPPEPTDGGAFYPASRVLRLNCLLAGTSAEVFSWRGAADAGLLAPSVQSNTMHIVISTTAAVLSLLNLYGQNRNQRHLPWWPP